MKSKRILSLVFILLVFFSICELGCSAEKDFSNRTASNQVVNANTGGANGAGSGAGSYDILNSGGNVSAGVDINSSGGGNVSEPEICADVNVQTSRVKPWVLFVVDRSGSTDEPFPGSSSKWQALYDSLMAPGTGVIPTLEAVAYFGMVLFDGGEENPVGWVNDLLCIFDPTFCTGTTGGSATATCPRLIQIDPALNNYNAINAEYSVAGPGGSTPTALALNAAYQMVTVSRQALLEEDQTPQFVVLCTDGEPNGCEGGGGPGGDRTDYQGPIDAVTAAANNGIKTFVVGIAVNDRAQAHLDELAILGNTGSPAFSPTTKDELVSKLNEIMGGAVGCQVKLDGAVAVGEECRGKVRLNGVELECSGPDGWHLLDESHIELQGAACTNFMSNSAAILEASFPCGVVVIE